MSIELKQAAQQAVEALIEARRYVVGAYECAFPDRDLNESVTRQIDETVTALQQAEAKTDELVQVFLVRDVASLLGASVPDVCDALAELGYEPRRSTNAAISPDEAIAVAKRINPAPGVPTLITKQQVMYALAFVPLDLSHPAKCQWIAEALTATQAQKGQP